MCRQTGKAIDGLQSLAQRMADALGFPVGALVGRRDYGSRLYELVDRNVSPRWQMKAFIRIAEAVASPANGLEDFKLSAMWVERTGEHHITITLSGLWVPLGDNVLIEGVRIGN
ncbi:MAG: hypothetical protein ACRDCY_21950 [Aeromonas veronii]